MSKRIDELWGQALDQAVPDTYSSLSWTQVEKIKAVFAELIVRECAGIVQPYMSRWEEDCDLVIKIKEHFGVEE
jgi:hypothetical protein